LTSEKLALYSPKSYERFTEMKRGKIDEEFSQIIGIEAKPGCFIRMASLQEVGRDKESLCFSTDSIPLEHLPTNSESSFIRKAQRLARSLFGETIEKDVLKRAWRIFNRSKEQGNRGRQFLVAFTFAA
jgi:hypothetical protein